MNHINLEPNLYVVRNLQGLLEILDPSELINTKQILASDFSKGPLIVRVAHPSQQLATVLTYTPASEYIQQHQDRIDKITKFIAHPGR